MSIDTKVTSGLSQQITLAFLRVATGFLLIWSGLNKIVTGSAPLMVQRSVEMADGTQAALGLGIGAVQLAIGVLCVIGLWRAVAFPLQAIIHGGTAASVWWAIIDPYRWYISGVDRIVFNSSVFYPTIITFAACVLLIAFRHQDRWCVDGWRAKHRP